MSKLIIEEWLSLDGYVSDKNGKLDFFAPHVRASYETPERMKYREGIDTILFGAKTYEQFATMWPNRTVEENMLAGKMNSARKIVFSRSLTEAPWGEHAPVEIEREDMATRVKELKAAQGGNIVVWGSITVAQALMAANVVDEYHLHICPVLTGGGRKLFTGDEQPGSMNLVSSRQYGPGIVHLHYDSE